MKILSFALIAVALAAGLALPLAGCGLLAEPPSPPEEAVEGFYHWYLGYPGNPLVDGAYRASPYLAEELVRKVDEALDSLDRGGFDPFLCAQDVPRSVTVDKAAVSGQAATAVVHGTEGHRFTVQLRLVEGEWKLADVICFLAEPTPAPEASPMEPEALLLEEASPAPTLSAPDEVTEEFYQWYLSYPGDALADGAYLESPLLTPGFIDRLAQAGPSPDGIDPIFCDQAKPDRVVVERVSFAGGFATVGAVTEPQERSLSVSLERVGEAWKVSGVECAQEEIESEAALPSPQEAVESFYLHYLAYIGDATQGEARSPLADKSFWASPELSPALVEEMAARLASSRDDDEDPFLCSEEVPTSLAVELVEEAGDAATVSVRTDPGGHSFLVRVELAAGRWRLFDILCPEAMEVSLATVAPDGVAPPAQVVREFYDWYLESVGDPAPGEPHAPLAEGAYRESELLAEAFVREVDRAAPQGLADHDPFLCGPDAPEAVAIGEVSISDERAVVAVRTDMEGQGLEVTLQLEEGEWKIAGVECAAQPLAQLATPQEQAAAVPSASPTPDTAGWSVLEGDYGFALRYPPDWTLQRIDLGNPELAKPMVSALALTPKRWEESYPPLVIEVSVGSAEEYRRLYPAPDEIEREEHPSVVAIREANVYDEVRQIRHVFQHPTSRDLRVTLLDWVTGFPERSASQEQVPGAIAAIVSTFQFTAP